jgi:hypothetical protein
MSARQLGRRPARTRSAQCEAGAGSGRTLKSMICARMENNDKLPHRCLVCHQLDRRLPSPFAYAVNI